MVSSFEGSLCTCGWVSPDMCWQPIMNCLGAKCPNVGLMTEEGDGHRLTRHYLVVDGTSVMSQMTRSYLIPTGLCVNYTSVDIRTTALGLTH